MAVREVVMSKKRYTEEFKIEAVRQVTERGYSVAEVAGRLGRYDFRYGHYPHRYHMVAAHRLLTH